MKWFKHYTDAYTNLKLRIIINEFGMQGYGAYWLLLELIGQQADEKFKLSTTKMWKSALASFSQLSADQLDKLLVRFADLDLIDKKALKYGNLYVPKMAEYSDDYTKRVRRMSEHSTDNVPLEEIRIEEKKKRLDKIINSRSLKTF